MRRWRSLVLVIGPWQGGRFAGADLVAQLEAGKAPRGGGGI
ncbi:MAG: hypothetical protein R3D85_07835 [Paracoccaceae bacterium]